MAENCPNLSCPGCPLMKKGDRAFCAKCDGDPEARPAPKKLPKESLPLDFTSRSPSESSSRRPSDASTPQTPSTPLSATHRNGLDDLPVLPRVDSATAQARRAQSDAASTEIGAKLLQGWTLLGDECSNPTCFGIPLMQAPVPRRKPTSEDPEEGDGVDGQRKTGRRKGKSSAALALQDPRKHCVVCKGMYLQESDLDTFKAFEAQQSAAAKPQAPGSKTDEGRSKQTDAALNVPAPSSSNETSRKRRSPEVDGMDNFTANRSKMRADEKVDLNSLSRHPAASTSATTALRSSLDRLSVHLQGLSDAPILNVQAISDTAAAMQVVCNSLKVAQTL